MKPQKRKMTEEDLESLVSCNRILKEQLDYLRLKLDRAEKLIEMLVKMTEDEEKEVVRKERSLLNNTFSLN